jgi:hypothetical protein
MDGLHEEGWHGPLFESFRFLLHLSFVRNAPPAGGYRSETPGAPTAGIDIPLKLLIWVKVRAATSTPRPLRFAAPTRRAAGVWGRMVIRYSGSDF